MSRVRRISQARCNALKHPKNSEMENAGEEIPELFFRSSTDREAKELLFLERFTFFQQGWNRASATLATRRRFSVELLQKIKQHFA
jgi:hypothetical protein